MAVYLQAKTCIANVSQKVPISDHCTESCSPAALNPYNGLPSPGNGYIFADPSPLNQLRPRTTFSSQRSTQGIQSWIAPAFLHCAASTWSLAGTDMALRGGFFRYLIRTQVQVAQVSRGLHPYSSAQHPCQSPTLSSLWPLRFTNLPKVALMCVSYQDEHLLLKRTR